MTRDLGPYSIAAFQRDRFGLFLHFGLYSLGARDAWAKSFEGLTDAHYDRYVTHFDPDLFDAAEWAATASAAGMRYAVLTAKHHEGFCLWDSALTDYTSTNAPFGRDLVAEFVEAFRAAGLRVGLYYSLVDWHHPQFPIDTYHPDGGGRLTMQFDLRAARDLDVAAAISSIGEIAERNRGRDIAVYRDYLHGQVRELLTGYGRIDVMWFDYSYPGVDAIGSHGKGRADWDSEGLVAMVRELQPGILVNDRLDLPGAADFHTPEQVQPRSWPEVGGERVVWEACQTIGRSWGYHRDEEGHTSPQQLIALLVNAVSCGGNLLLNVGPNGRGRFDDRALAALDVYRRWLDVHARAIYGCTASPYAPPSGCRYTQRGDRLYLHLLDWPLLEVHLDGLAGSVAYAQLLHDGSEIPFATPHPPNAGGYDDQTAGALTLRLPVRRPEVTVPVVEMFLD